MINIHCLKSHKSFSQCALHRHSHVSCACTFNMLSDVASICKATLGEATPTQETKESQNVDNGGSELNEDVYELKTQ